MTGGSVDTAHNILFCMRWGIGDLLMQLPVLDELRQHAPADARLVVLAAAPAADLVEDHPAVDAVARFQDFGLEHRWDASEDASLRIRSWIERERFDLILDPVHAPDAAAEAAWESPVPCLVRDATVEQQVLARGRSAYEASVVGMRHGWGLPAGPVPPASLDVADEAPFAAAFLDRLGIAEGEPVALVTAGSLPMKQWPAERFGRLAAQIHEATRAPILVFGAPEDEALARTVIAAAGSARAAMHVVEPLPLAQAGALLKACRVVVANDTGLLHLAHAVGTPVVGIYGPTDPEVYLPPRAAAAAAATPPCTYARHGTLQPPDCWSTARCLVGLRSCIDAVEVENVAAAVNRVLSRT